MLTVEEKELREEYGYLLDEMAAISERARVNNRNMTTDEVDRHKELVQQAKKKKEKIKNLSTGRGGNTTMNDIIANSLDSPGGSDVNKLPHNGGKALNDSGSIRLYRPQDKLSADSTREPGQNNVDLGSYLRSVIDKPQTQSERAAVQNSVDSSGYTLPSFVSTELIDRLRAANPVIAAGARTISIQGLDGTKFVKITGDPDAVWHTELDEENFSDPNFDDVELKPRTVLALVEVGRELLQDSANVDEALTSAFVGAINNAILTATFTGAGGKEPTGLATQITQTEEYTNGGNPDWTHFVKASKTLHDNNVPENGRSFIYAPDVWELLALDTDDNGRYQDAPSFIRDVPGFTSSGVSDGESYAGDFSNVVYGYRMNITLEQHQGISARKYASVWLAAARLDIAVFRPSALIRIEEASA